MRGFAGPQPGAGSDGELSRTGTTSNDEAEWLLRVLPVLEADSRLKDAAGSSVVDAASRTTWKTHESLHVKVTRTRGRGTADSATLPRKPALVRAASNTVPQWLVISKHPVMIAGLLCGVPQGSNLGPGLFSVHLLILRSSNAKQFPRLRWMDGCGVHINVVTKSRSERAGTDSSCNGW